MGICTHYIDDTYSCWGGGQDITPQPSDVVGAFSIMPFPDSITHLSHGTRGLDTCAVLETNSIVLCWGTSSLWGVQLSTSSFTEVNTAFTLPVGNVLAISTSHINVFVFMDTLQFKAKSSTDAYGAAAALNNFAPIGDCGGAFCNPPFISHHNLPCAPGLVPSGTDSNFQCVTCPAGYACHGTAMFPCLAPGETCLVGSKLPQSCTVCSQLSSFEVSPCTRYADAVCTPICNPGFYQIDTTITGPVCELCPADSYCKNGNRNICPDPNMQAPTGSEKLQNCTCRPEYYTLNDTTCAYCPENHFCLGGSHVEPCHDHCPAGTALQQACTAFHDTVCTACPEGSWCESGMLYSCAQHATSRTGASSALQCECAAGFTGPPGGPCYACPADHYCPGLGDFV
eukprot:2966283-Rhodomonas_salina.1